jgi:hypothetical protein
LTGGADDALGLRGGTFTATPAAGPAVSTVVTAGDKAALVLESPAPLAGARRMTALVRLRTNDHIDVGRSLYRQANLTGYLSW